MNFLMALLCLVGAVVVFVYQIVTGDRRFHILNTNISAGWLLLLMAAYNLVRWWSVRSYQLQQQELRAQAARVRARFRERERQPDPNFDFTDAPPAPPTGNDPPASGSENGAGDPPR